jgi:hypothetical protein
MEKYILYGYSAEARGKTRNANPVVTFNFIYE